MLLLLSPSGRVVVLLGSRRRLELLEWSIIAEGVPDEVEDDEEDVPRNI